MRGRVGTARSRRNQCCHGNPSYHNAVPTGLNHPAKSLLRATAWTLVAVSLIGLSGVGGLLLLLANFDRRGVFESVAPFITGFTLVSLALAALGLFMRLVAPPERVGKIDNDLQDYIDLHRGWQH